MKRYQWVLYDRKGNIVDSGETYNVKSARRKVVNALMNKDKKPKRHLFYKLQGVNEKSIMNYQYFKSATKRYKKER